MIDREMKKQGTSLRETISWANVMMYDEHPSEVNKPNGLDLETYKIIFENFSKYINEDQIVIGFEPGGQAGKGAWEGLDVDK